MVGIVVFSLIPALIMTVLIVPFTNKRDKNGVIKTLSIFLSTVYIISFIIIIALFYFMKLDLNWSVLLYGLPVVAVLGAIFSSGVE